MAETNYREHLKGDKVRAKKYFSVQIEAYLQLKEFAFKDTIIAKRRSKKGMP